jgi:hypothetical protein
MAPEQWHVMQPNWPSDRGDAGAHGGGDAGAHGGGDADANGSVEAPADEVTA